MQQLYRKSGSNSGSQSILPSCIIQNIISLGGKKFHSPFVESKLSFGVMHRFCFQSNQTVRSVSICGSFVISYQFGQAQLMFDRDTLPISILWVQANDMISILQQKSHASDIQDDMVCTIYNSSVSVCFVTCVYLIWLVHSIQCTFCVWFVVSAVLVKTAHFSSCSVRTTNRA